MDWQIGMFVWLNVVGVIALVIWLDNKRIKAATSATEALRGLLQSYADAAEGAGITAQQAIQSVTATNQAALAKMGEDYKLILRHDAAMASGQCSSMMAMLKRVIEEHGHLTLKMLHTLLIAEQTAAGRVAGNGTSADLMSSLRSVAESHVELGASQDEPPEIGRPTVSPLVQG